MLVSTVLSQARKLANDNDATNPFHTDAELYEFVSDWLHEIGTEIGFPRKQQSISFAAADGGAAGTKNLDNDLSAIFLAVWRDTTSGNEWILAPRTEAEMAAENTNWRDEGNAKPSYYIVQDSITAQAQAIGPLRTITTDKPVDAAGTLRLYGMQMPAVVSAGTNSPVFPAPFHKSCVYYVAAHMWMPRDRGEADYYLDLHANKLRRLKTLAASINADSRTPIWDQYDEGEAEGHLSR